MNQTAFCFMVAAGLCLDALAAVNLSDVSWTQDDATRQVVCTYTLEGEPAVVTAEVLVDGSPIDAENHGFFIGDVNRIVSAGAGRWLAWRPDKAWPGAPLDVTLRLKATTTANAPDYMVVDLARQGDVRYYASESELPSGGLTNDMYRTRKLVLRRVPAAGIVWNMGSPSSEPNRQSYEVQHRVLLTKDYWMAVFETTQAQFQLVTGRNPSYSANAGALKPVDNVFGCIRDKNARTSDSESHPDGAFSTASPVEGSFLDLLGSIAGLDFDLPTEAQWEYACRAGTTSSYNNGNDKLSVSDIGNFKDYNGYTSDAASGDSLHRVGSLLPNAWGLYDMHGNVYEWCLDTYKSDKYGFASLDGVLVDPRSPVDAGVKDRVRRGGTYRGNASDGRSASRFYYSGPFRGTGFRVICTGYAKQ